MVTCLAGGQCLAIATGAMGTMAVAATGPGAPWLTVGTLPAGTTGATGVSCADNRNCWVTDQRPVDADHAIGTVSYTTDFGAQWTQETVPFGTGSLGGLACSPASSSKKGSLPYSPSSSTGPTTSSATESTAPAGTSGTSAAPTTTSTTAPTTTSTAAPTIATTTTTTTTLPGVPGFDCTVVGTTATTLNGARTGRGVIITTTNGGSSWTRQHVPNTAAAFTDVSCPSSGSCVVVGTSVAATPQAGVVVLTGEGSNTWRRADSVAVSQPVTAVSCPSLGHCVLVGETVSERLDAS